jgi:hypothetical protein
MKKSLNPQDSALLAQWLTVSRANPAPVTMECPSLVLNIAYGNGLMGVTRADVERMLAEVIASIPPQPRTGPPSLGSEGRAASGHGSNGD